MDPFLDNKVCEDRLFEEWQKYGKLIIAYDFDNTVFPYSDPNYTFDNVIELLRECKKNEFWLVVFTSCNEDRIPELKEYLKKHNIPYDSINETADFIPFKGRKIYYNLLLDDRAGLSAAYMQLKSVLYKIRGVKNEEYLSTLSEIA